VFGVNDEFGFFSYVRPERELRSEFAQRWLGFESFSENPAMTIVPSIEGCLPTYSIRDRVQASK